ncbi:MAG: PAS domain S-box protein [Ignavibacteriales bacterium]|nr:PAS domain S-box protein [Ignavibacteriales bacterium]
MKSDRKTKNELIKELESVRRKVKKLENLLEKRKHTQQDITERLSAEQAGKQAEKALRESEERYRSLFEKIDEGFCVVEMLYDPDGMAVDYRFVEINQAFEKHTGLQQALGKTIRQMVPNHDAHWFEIYGKVARTGEAIRFENPAIAMQRYYDVFAFRIGGDGSQRVGVLFTDITERKRAEEELRNRESILQKVFDILPVGLWFADKDGKLLRGNPAGVKIWGAEPKVTPSEYGVFKGRRLPSGEELAPDDWALAHTIMDKVTIVDELLEIDAFDGRKKTILNYTAPVLDALGNIQGAIVVNQDITERKRAEEEINKSHKELHMLADHLQNIREEERNHLAREFHDRLGQSMTALKMDLSLLLRTISDEKQDISRPYIAGELKSAKKLIDEMSRLIWEIIADLRPQMLDDLGLLAALEWETEGFESRTGISCEFQSSAGDIQIDSKKSIALFRIYQEVLTNILRHAHATIVKSALRRDDEMLVFEIKDNGRGITLNEQSKANSFGLIGMRERALALGGQLKISGIADEGTTIIVRLPL